MDCAHAHGICSKLQRARDLRRKYQTGVPLGGTVDPATPIEVYFGEDGLMHVRTTSADGTSPGEELFKPPALEVFENDMAMLHDIRTYGPVSSFCLRRLRLLQTRFELYLMTSGDEEQRQVSGNGHRDFYNVRKVDTHVHHSASMNGKHLLRFMKKKLKTHYGDKVDGQRTLNDIFAECGLKWGDLNVDKLEVWADADGCMHRFDRFNKKYSPIGHNDLRTVFLKTDNAMGGRYLAELTRELLDDLEEAKYQHVEWRLSIYGRNRQEWQNLSCWVLGENGKGLSGGKGLLSPAAYTTNRRENKSKALLSPNLRWMIQIPRLFGLYRSTNQLNNFGEMLENIFQPMFEATLDPEAHPYIARFLQEISGFDTVDDESRSQGALGLGARQPPPKWDLPENPPYKYYSYFISANLRVLNSLRRMKGLNQFSYRPHAGEAGDVQHLDVAFMLADGINHGINLRKSPALQYLFYVEQIGIAMSPCSNNQLFLAYAKNPYPIYFARGLNVSLSTDDPLMFHQTKEPLMEEYSIAKQLWRFSAVDICDMARNSVLQSGFDDTVKAKWLGTEHFLTENDPLHTNVPNIRVGYRRRMLQEELSMLRDGAPKVEVLDKVAQDETADDECEAEASDNTAADSSDNTAQDDSADDPCKPTPAKRARSVPEQTPEMANSPPKAAAEAPVVNGKGLACEVIDTRTAA